MFDAVKRVSQHAEYGFEWGQLRLAWDSPKLDF